ncbi:MAG TPA: tetratricopeptide repeat protein [Gemmatimonadaceae bacterium]|nr:tetratricopeptide repeat protein [Gemmatimonadaceae bacterium]
MPSTKPARGNVSTRDLTFTEWVQLHAKQVTAAVIVLLLIGGGVWFYLKMQQNEEEHAASSLGAARVAIASKNAVLARNELERLTSRWPHTEAGELGAVLLAQLNFEQGRFQEAVQVLQHLRSVSPDYSPGPVQNLIGQGLEQLAKPLDAAKAYEAAAASARFPRDSSEYLMSAARAYMTAGKKADAEHLWRALAESSSQDVAAEARLRLGEVSAEPARAKRS